MRPQAVACRLCSDAGYVRVDLPVGHPDYGRPVRCSCREAADRAALYERSRHASNLAGTLLGKTFATFASYPEVAEAYAALLAFASAPAGWLVL